MRVQVQCVTLSGQFAQKLLNLYGENFRHITSTGLVEIQKGVFPIVKARNEFKNSILSNIFHHFM
jgi:hypothetical protein